MEFSFTEVGDRNFSIKEFHEKFFPVKFDISFMRFYQYFSYYTSTVALPKQYWFDLNKWALFHISRSEVFLWNWLTKKSL